MNKKLSILGIGILLSPLFPTAGIRTLVTKILERVFFNIDVNPMMFAIIAGTIGLVTAVIVLRAGLKYFAKFDYNNPTEVRTALKHAVFIFITYELIWVLIPLVDGQMGSTYMERISKGYDSLIPNYELLVSTPFWIIGTLIGIVIINRTVNHAANKR